MARDGRYNCDRCPFGRHCDESNPAPFAKFAIRGSIEIESRVCFLPMIAPQSRFLLRMYQHYKNRFLPRAGGVLNQSNYYLEAMEIISSVLDRDNGKHRS